jgi:hypothetical protein
MRMLCQTDIPAERRVLKAVVAGGLFLGLAVLSLVSPANLPLPECAFHSLTGRDCLTCGLTRSLHAILHGDLAASVRYHLFGPAVFLAMLLSFMLFAAEAVCGKGFVLCAREKIRNRIIGLFAALWLVHWSIRLLS